MHTLPDGVGVSAPTHNSVNKADHEIFVSSEFDAHDLMTWWDVFASDPARVGAYIDPLPERLDDFLALARSDRLYFFLLYHYGKVMGASWLHDVMPYGSVRSAWMGHYHLPEHRRLRGLNARDQRGVFHLAERIGIPAIFAACRSSNTSALRSIASSGFHWCGHIDDFALFGGELDSAEVHTLRLEDADECITQARMRANAYRARDLPACIC